jgi:sugar/nucleoside kinase (ribokinase family)
VATDLIVATPAFLDLTFVGLEALPAIGEERFAGDLVRSPGGGAITAVAGARLGLRTALVAPLGDDVAGEWVRRELEGEGVTVDGTRTSRTPQTLVMPCGEDRAMVTVDPGARARAADVAAQMPAAAVACNLEQLHLVPEGARVLLTCGEDDARAFAGRLPAGIDRTTALFLDAHDAQVLTGTDTLGAAVDALATRIPTIVVTRGSQPAAAILQGERLETATFDIGPAVDTTGDRDLLCAAYAWADVRGADPLSRVRWAQLYAALAVTVPTATGGAVTDERLLEEGVRRGLEPPPQARPR